MRLGELTYLTDQIVTFGFSSLELRNKAHQRLHHRLKFRDVLAVWINVGGRLFHGIHCT